MFIQKNDGSVMSLRTRKDFMDFVGWTDTPQDDSEDSFLEYCAQNNYDPDSTFAQHTWAEMISYLGTV